MVKSKSKLKTEGPKKRPSEIRGEASGSGEKANSKDIGKDKKMVWGNEGDKWCMVCNSKRDHIAVLCPKNFVISVAKVVTGLEITIRK